MSYSCKSIKDMIKEIESSKVFLPAIQRKFVWNIEKIEKLFDSIVQNYPIGTFLFWELEKTIANEYVFYEFLRNYDQRNPYNIKKNGSFLHPEIIGVLDGQQRLSSMYIGLQGTHRQKLKNYRKSSDHAYPEKTLHVNLLSLPYKNENGVIEIDSTRDFEFKFLTVDETNRKQRKKPNKDTEYLFWFRVGDVLAWNIDPDIDDIYDQIIDDNIDSPCHNSLKTSKRYIKKFLRVLHKRITSDQLINYFTVKTTDLESVLKIFLRVNGRPTILSKSDLLFSTIVATWEDGRENIENFIKLLNSKGDGFNFNNDFLMRSCLVLSDLAVLFRVNSFKSENVLLIKNNWEDIKLSIEKTVDLLVSFGFSGSRLTSQNSIIIIAYFFIKGGSDNEESKENIRKYILHALLRNIYGGQGDQVITSLRNTLTVHPENDKSVYQLISNIFPFDDLYKSKLPANKTLKINEDDINEYMTYKKGSSTFLILSMLYPNIKFTEVQFHQDHIHPATRFSNHKLKELTIDEEKWNLWNDMKDMLPNLQLMEGIQNQEKNASPFKVWLHGKSKKNLNNVQDIEKYYLDNYIPKNIEYDLSNFEQFYEERKKLMTTKLLYILGTDTNKIDRKEMPELENT